MVALRRERRHAVWSWNFCFCAGDERDGGWADGEGDAALSFGHGPVAGEREQATDHAQCRGGEAVYGGGAAGRGARPAGREIRGMGVAGETAEQFADHGGAERLSRADRN
jgi:hypothetical protein